MTKEQFLTNKENLVDSLHVAKLKSANAAQKYNDYQGNNTAEEHRLSLMWQSADAKILTVQKKIDLLEKQFYIQSKENALALRYA